MLRSLADIFCELYDGIDLPRFRREVAAWDDGSHESATLLLELQAISGALDGRQLRERVADADDPELTRYVILRALDRALMRVNPMMPGTPCPPELALYQAEVIATHRLDSGTAGGALLPRPVRRDVGLPDHPREAFDSVVRVDAESWSKCTFSVLPAHVSPLAHEVQEGLRVGCVPFVEDPAEMTFEVRQRHGQRYYEIGLADGAPTMHRVGSVLDKLIAADVQIGLIPELMLTPTLLCCWESALSARRGRTGSLLWLLVGSGNMRETDRPSNTAMLLSARTGQPLAEQSKMFAFDFEDAETLNRWNLTDRLGELPIREHLAAGERLTIVDSGLLRLAILVCEDLARVVDLGPSIRSFGVSHILVPTFARPMKDHRWEQKRAEVHNDATGALAIVTNSRVMHTVTGDEGATGGVFWKGGYLLLNSTSADDIEVFTLTPEGTARR